MIPKMQQMVLVWISLWTASSQVLAQPFGDSLDNDVYWVLKRNCTKCHDELGEQQAASGVADLLDLEVLASAYLDASDEELLNDLVMGDEARMPKPSFDKVQWNGPMSSGDKNILRQWIDRGGPSEQYLSAQQQPPRDRITLGAVAKAVQADLQSLRGSDVRNARYLTLANAYNDPDVTEAELEIYRAAVVKTLNSLSSSSEVLGIDTSDANNKIVAIDDARTILRFDLRNIGWKSTKWDLVARHYPFDLDDRSAMRQQIAASTSSSVPVMRADWFVFAVLQPPLYHQLADIPDTLTKLEDSLNLDRLDAIRDRRVARAGMIESKVSVNNRLLERIPMTGRSGAYHISYDFASNTGKQNFRDFPLGPPGAFKSAKSFTHDGGEVIFNLPNGYQAYMLVDGVGRRLDIAPQAIVQDRTMPGSVIINGVSCLSCHFQGMKPERYSPRLDTLDEVREAVLDNNIRFDAAEKELVTELHVDHEKFVDLVESDRERFLNALEASGIPQKGATEPARALFDYFKNSLTLGKVAAEFGLDEDDLRSRLERESETRQVLTVAEKGILKRQEWMSLFGRTARLIGLGSVREPAELPYPYFGDKVENLAHNEAIEQSTTPDVGHTGVDLVDMENRDGLLKIDMWTEDERRSYQEGELLRVRVRANQDCFLTLVSIDPLGDMTLLMPNSFHGNFPLRGNRTETIPTEQMEFDFVTQPPHGRTILKAIATKRPLDLRGVTQQRLANEGLASLGRAKGFGVRQSSKQRPTQRPKLDRLTVNGIEEQFAPNEWATGSFSVTTRP